MRTSSETNDYHSNAITYASYRKEGPSLRALKWTKDKERTKDYCLFYVYQRPLQSIRVNLF